MRNQFITLSIVFFLFSVCAQAQAPKMMNYQGVARSADGQTLVNKQINLRLSIISADDVNDAVYKEEQLVTTNEFGLFAIKIGQGSPLLGSMDAINWGSADHFISVEMDADNNGHFAFMGTSQLLSVPYAFYAETAGKATNLENIDQMRAIDFTGTSGQTIRHNGSDWEASSTIYSDGTNVGIGTTSPTEKLDIDGSINLSTGGEITFDGDRALAMDASRNIMQGRQTGEALTSGVNNNMMGYRAGWKTTTGSNNSIIGYNAGYSNTTGSWNTMIGYKAGYSNTEGANNFYSGPTAGYGSTTGINNVAIGTGAGLNIGAANNNTFIGRNSGYNTTANENMFVGYEAGYNNTTGTRNTYLGTGADGDTSLTNATAIGYNAYAASSNSVVLGNAANVGVGTNSPAAKLHVEGDLRLVDGTQADGYVLTSDASGNASWEAPSFNSLATNVLTLQDGCTADSYTVLDAKNNASPASLHVGSGLWQSFTAEQTGYIDTVAVRFSSAPSSVTIHIYEGEGTTDFLGEISLSGSYVASWNSFDVSSLEIPMSAGEQYTFEFVTSHSIRYVSGNPYSGGKCSVDDDEDMSFRIYTKVCENEVISLSSDSVGVLLNGIDTLNFSDGSYLTSGLISFAFDTLGGVVIPGGAVDETADDFVFGSTQLDDDGNTEHFSRFFFDKSKSAFRAGSVIETRWNADSLGNYSFASGYNTIASGIASTALGFRVNATGDNSAALGYFTTASGENSTAMGSQTVASEYNSTALGAQTTASGTNSLASGYYTIASGNNSIATGAVTTASGTTSTAMGSGTTASGSSSTALGSSTIASASKSTAMGDDTEASGTASTAMGDGTTASGTSSTAMGVNSVASGTASTATGGGTQASAIYSTAMGSSTTASGSASTAMGEQTVASGYASLATGVGAVASGEYSTAMGEYTTAPSAYEISIGRYNTNYTPNSTTAWDDSDRLFTIGNGESSPSRSNAMVVLKSGEIGIGTNTPDTTLHVVGQIKYDDGNQADGYVLTSDNSGNASWTAASSLAVTTVFDTASGVVYPGSAVDIANDDFVFGSTQLNDDGNTNHDRRFFFDKSKAAFRTGQATGKVWDVDSLGLNSFATGYNAKARANYCNAMGNAAVAKGDASTAIGSFTEASGEHSIAMGRAATASSSYALAMGRETEASGIYSLALGYTTTASGLNSTAMGGNTISPSGYETSIGRYNTEYTPSSVLGWDESDRLFTIGNGESDTSRSDAMVVLKNGNVGIGTDSASNQLEVYSTVGGDGKGITIANPRPVFKLEDTDANTWLIEMNAKNLNFTEDTVGTVLTLENTSGYVGIGTTNPITQLDVETSDALTDVRVYNDNGSGTARAYIGANGGGHINLIANASGSDVYGIPTTLTGIATQYKDMVFATGTGSNNSTEKMRLTTGGNLGIGYTNPVYKLQVNGQIATTSPLIITSDRKFKTNIEPICSALSKIEQLQGVTYDWKTDEFPNTQFDKRKQLGFIAQDVELIVPEAVSINDKGDYGLSYTTFTPLLVEAIKELKKENEALKAQLLEEKTKNQTRLERIEAELGIGIKASNK